MQSPTLETEALRLRAPARGDAGALLAFFRGLSQRSLYLRFHGLPHVDRALVEPYLDSDWAERGALIGTIDDRVVALANYVRLPGSSEAEVAFVVEDELQGHGIGTQLLEQLADRAARHGIDRFVAEVMADNVQMLSVFTGAGFEVSRELQSDEIEVRFPLTAGGATRSVKGW